MRATGGKVSLALPASLAALNSERLQGRMKQFARLIGGDPEVRTACQNLGPYMVRLSMVYKL